MRWRNSLTGPAVPRVLLADRSPLYREGLKLGLDADDETCLEANHFDAIAPLLAAHPLLELLVLELGLPGWVHPQQLSQLLQRYPMPVLLLADRPDSSMLQTGISGVISKAEPLSVLREALLTVREGGCWLPQRVAEPVPRVQDSPALAGSLPSLSRCERRVLQLLASGLPNKAIGRRLRISESTVKSHVDQIYRKLRVDNRILLASAIQALPHFPPAGRGSAYSPTDHSLTATLRR